MELVVWITNGYVSDLRPINVQQEKISIVTLWYLLGRQSAYMLAPSVMLLIIAHNDKYGYVE